MTVIINPDIANGFSLIIIQLSQIFFNRRQYLIGLKRFDDVAAGAAVGGFGGGFDSFIAGYYNDFHLRMVFLDLT